MPRLHAAVRPPLFVLLSCLALVAACSTSTPPPETATAPAPADDEVAEDTTLPHPTQAEADAWLDEGRSFIAITSSDSCGACGPYLDKIEPLVVAHPDWPVVVLHNFDQDWLETHTGYFVGLPATVFYEAGHPVDVMTGGRHDQFEAFVARNLAPTAQRDLTDVDRTDIPALRKQLRFGYVAPNSDLASLPLSALELHGVDLSGSDLRNTDLTGAVLDRVSFSRSDLTGAQLQGAALSEVFWGAAICPDGTHSADHGHTCEGHLNTDAIEHHDLDAFKGRTRACYDRLREELDAVTDPTLRERVQFRGTIRCTWVQRAGVEFTDTWQPMTLEEARPLIESSRGAPSLDWIAQSGCEIEHLATAEEQRDAPSGVAIMFCDESPAPWMFATGDKSAAE